MEETLKLGHRIIRASAGTGKTYQLSNRYLALLLSGENAERILATTFTRKAAGEILDRIIIRLSKAATDKQARLELAEALGIAKLSAKRCLTLTQAVLLNLHRLRVSTLDSHYAQLARGMSLDLGLPAHWRIIEEWEERALRKRALEIVLTSAGARELHTLTHLLAKGETRRGIADLLWTTVSDLHALYRETSPEVWKGLSPPPRLSDQELAEALEQLRTAELPAALSRSRLADYDAALRQDWDTFISRGIPSKLLKGEHSYSKAPLTGEIEALYEPLLKQARSVLLQRVAAQNEASYRLLERFDVAYQELKQQTGGLRFEDLTQSLARLSVADDPESAALLRLAFRTDGEIDHLLLDEFQDTAPAQWRALEPLVDRVMAVRDSGRTFFCVGDVKQAIYAWRGGLAEIFDWIEDNLPQLERSALDCSYRSSQPVIDTVNAIFGNLCRHPNLDRHADAVNAWCERFPPHRTALTELPGYACLVTASQASERSRQELTTLEAAAQRIAQLHRQRPQASIGVLVRKNRTVGKLIFLLRDQGVPASEEGGNPLTDSAAVDLVLSLLQLIDHPGDTAARFHVSQSPLGPLVGLTAPCDDRQAHRVASDWRRRLAVEGYTQVLQSWSQHLHPQLDHRERNRLRQLIDLTFVFTPRVAGRTGEFIQYVSQERVADPSTSSVRVMTVHQSKGLQFDAVFLPELEGAVVGPPNSFVVARNDPTRPVQRICRYGNLDLQRLLPPAYQAMFAAEAERSVSESLSVLYVALTRAKHALYMVIAPSLPNERNLPQRYSGLVRAALTDGQRAPPDSVLYSCGQENWTQLACEEQDQPDRAAPLPVAAIKLASHDRPRRSWERVTPSQLEGGPRLRIADVLAPHETEARRRGIAIHALMEQIVWLEQPPPNRDALRTLLQRTVSPADETWLEKRLDDFEELIKLPEVAQLLDPRSYRDLESWGLPPGMEVELEVRTEYAFAIELEERLMTGSIDRLVLISQGGVLVGADVIDFKTDRFDTEPHAPPRADPSQLEAKVAFYRPQISAYCRAVAAMTGIEPRGVRGRLVFLATGEVVSVAPAAPRETLDRR